MIELHEMKEFEDSALFCPTCFKVFPITKCKVHIDLEVDTNSDYNPNPNRIIHDRRIFNEGSRESATVYYKNRTESCLIDIPCPHCNVSMIRIDNAIAPYLVDLNRLGINTHFSCGGHLQLVDPFDPSNTKQFMTFPYVILSAERAFRPHQDQFIEFDKKFKLPTETQIQYSYTNPIKMERVIYVSIKPFDRKYNFLQNGFYHGMDKEFSRLLSCALSFRLFNQIIGSYIGSMCAKEKVEKALYVDTALHHCVMEKAFYQSHEDEIISKLDALERMQDKF